MAKTRLSKGWYKLVISDLETELVEIVKDKRREVLKESIDYEKYKDLYDEELRIELLITGLSHPT